MSLNFPPDTREFVELLNSYGVKYVLLGGYAVGFHGHPRFTKDADFFVEASVENGERVVRAVNDFGFDSFEIKPEQVAEGVTITMGRAPWRIDIIASADGITFAEAWATHIEATIAGVKLNVISRDLLIRNKLATGRGQDVADANTLLKRPPVDEG